MNYARTNYTRKINESDAKELMSNLITTKCVRKAKNKMLIRNNFDKTVNKKKGFV